MVLFIDMKAKRAKFYPHRPWGFSIDDGEITPLLQILKYCFGCIFWAVLKFDVRRPQ